MVDINFAVQSYKHDSLPISAQSCLNAFAELQPADARAPVTVHGAPGIDPFTALGSGPIRGMIDMRRVAYAVSRDQFFRFNADGTYVLLGGGIPGVGVVSIACNGTQIAIVAEGRGFIYDVDAGNFVEITDSDFLPANTITFIDGYFAADRKDTNQWALSDLTDGTSWDPLMFASAESSPDDVLGVFNIYGNLGIYGEKTIELWQDTGALAFPFQPFAGGTIERGIGAPLARVDIDNSHYLLGNDRVFYRLAGGGVQRVSQHAIEREWQTYDTVADAFCFTWEFAGHKFIIVTFPGANRTWVVDTATGLWHQRASWDSTGAIVRWRANCMLDVYGKTYVGDAYSGRIGIVNKTIYTEWDQPILMELTAPPIFGNGRTGFMPLFELDMETGVGLTDGQGSDPQVALMLSDDGGRTFGSEIWRSFGARGQYPTKVWWQELGSFNSSRTLRIRITDPVKRTILRARCPGLYWEDVK